MSRDSSLGPLEAHRRLIARLYEKAGAARWGLPVEAFAEALTRSGERRYRPAPLASVATREVAAYLQSLHVADLALACACAKGSEPAWDEFMLKFRPVLYAAARAVSGGAAARELADSLYADLYGVAERDGRRRPLFEYFHGRSQLSTWLRAVLAQRHVDQVRAARRMRALDDEGRMLAASGSVEGTHRGEVTTRGSVTQLAVTDPPPDPDRPRLATLFHQAVTHAVASLSSADRLRLSYYYLHTLTLAEIGRLMGEHESTASRKLERTRQTLRTNIERRLRQEHRLKDGEIRQCYEQATEDREWDLAALLKPDGS